MVRPTIELAAVAAVAVSLPQLSPQLTELQLLALLSVQAVLQRSIALQQLLPIPLVMVAHLPLDQLPHMVAVRARKLPLLLRFSQMVVPCQAQR